ncbi:hypothetical protein Ahy_A08g041317 isoform E [Arachis hypogaea]|uniref:Uncharacterized protein n=1 Tax=Arachis hypogaea TaxID=3818 RepID=A0A445C2C7_ARAHY|nr:hypothetical protein Ahy_A08g041317 isoform E [Arachis hypogaea]
MGVDCRTVSTAEQHRNRSFVTGVPSPKDVPDLKKLGVEGVISLNEQYKTVVPSSLYHHHIVKNSSFVVLCMSLVQGRLTPLKQCELSYFEHTFEYCKPSCEEPLHYTFDVRWRFRPCCRREAPPLFVHPSPTRGFS